MKCWAALQDATELVVTLPLLLALVHWIAPSVRALSHSSLKLQLQFGVDGSAGFYRIEKSGTLLRLRPNKITVRIRFTLNTQNTPRLPQQETEGCLLCFICVGSSPYAITCGDS